MALWARGIFRSHSELYQCIHLSKNHRLWFHVKWKTIPLGLLLRTRHLNSLNNRSCSRRSTLIGWLTRILIRRWLAELYSDWLTDNISTLIRPIICYYLRCRRSAFWNRQSDWSVSDWLIFISLISHCVECSIDWLTLTFKWFYKMR